MHSSLIPVEGKQLATLHKWHAARELVDLYPPGILMIGSSVIVLIVKIVGDDSATVSIPESWIERMDRKLEAAFKVRPEVAIEPDS